MSELTTVRVTSETLRAIRRLCGEAQANSDRRVTHHELVADMVAVYVDLTHNGKNTHKN